MMDDPVTPLTIAELWALPTMLRTCVRDYLRRQRRAPTSTALVASGHNDAPIR